MAYRHNPRVSQIARNLGRRVTGGNYAGPVPLWRTRDCDTCGAEVGERCRNVKSVERVTRGEPGSYIRYVNQPHPTRRKTT